MVKNQIKITGAGGAAGADPGVHGPRGAGGR